MQNILFVCTGNTCRSPMAEALLKHKSQDFHVQSAGLFAFPGGPANEYAIQVLREKGVACQHQSQQTNEELVKWADLVLAMTNHHKQHLQENFPEYASKVHTLKQFVDSDAASLDISDPFGGSLETYRQTMSELDVLIDKLIEKIKPQKRTLEE